MEMVWILEETSAEFGGKAARAFGGREPAVNAARSAIDDYRNHSLVAREVDEVLRHFDEECASSEEPGAGDSGALFYVQVRHVEAESLSHRETTRTKPRGKEQVRAVPA